MVSAVVGPPAGTNFAPAQLLHKVREEQDWQLIYGDALDTSEPVRILLEQDVTDGQELRSSPVKTSRTTANSALSRAGGSPPAARKASPARRAPAGQRPSNDWKARLGAVHKFKHAAPPRSVCTAQGSVMIVPVKRGRGRPPKNALPPQKLIVIPPLLPKNPDGAAASVEEQFAMERPLHYLRYAPPLEQFDVHTGEAQDGWVNRAMGDDGRLGVMASVEYDMDEQDFAWLRAANDERRAAGLPRVDEDDFEYAVDRLEKYWFNLTKAYQKWQSRIEDSSFAAEFTCEICGEGDTTSANLIVMCDGCDIAVHQDCYGIVHIPEGPWLCRKCYLGSEPSARCSLCPWPEGALKQTTDAKRPWAHLVCAHYLQHEAAVLNPSFQEPIDLGRLDPGRSSLTCIYCKQRGAGAPVQCAAKTCHFAFHPLCAKRAGALLDHARQTGLCWKHSCLERPPAPPDEPLDVEHHSSSGSSEVDVEAVSTPHASARRPAPPSPVVLMKRGRGRPPLSRPRGGPPTPSMALPPVPFIEVPAAGKPAKGGASGGKRAEGKPVWLLEPIAPRVILDRIAEAPDLLPGDEPDDRLAAVATIAKYWSLKRSAKRGMPLLRRLQLEPWTSSATISDAQSIRENSETRRYLLADLQRLEALAAAVAQREKRKLAALAALHEQYTMAAEPLLVTLRVLLRTAIALDRSAYFVRPVSPADVPDYLDHIQTPMDLATMAQRLEAQHYASLEQFLGDLALVSANAKSYNTPDTVYYAAAQQLEDGMQAPIAAARRVLKDLRITADSQVSLRLLQPLAPQLTAEEAPAEDTARRRVPSADNGADKKTHDTPKRPGDRQPAPPQQRAASVERHAVPLVPPPPQQPAPKTASPGRPATEQAPAKKPVGHMQPVWAPLARAVVWPGRVVDPARLSAAMRSAISPRVLSGAQPSKLLVEFLDAGRSWKWVDPDRLVPLSRNMRTDVKACVAAGLPAINATKELREAHARAAGR